MLQVNQQKITPYQPDKKTNNYNELANYIIKKSGCNKGYCLILDAEDCRLSYSLAQKTDLKIIIVQKDVKKTAQQQTYYDRPASMEIEFQFTI